MQATDILLISFDMSRQVLKAYFNDFNDVELRESPGPGCQPIAWQLGHLIASECSLINMVRPNCAPELPAGFAELHSKEAAATGDVSKYLGKQEYLDLLDQVGAKSKEILASLSESELDQPGPERFQPMFPKVGHLANLIATHAMMHAGQFVPVRRRLNKPIVI